MSGDKMLYLSEYVSQASQQISASFSSFIIAFIYLII